MSDNENHRAYHLSQLGATRRELLLNCWSGIGSLALAALMPDLATAADPSVKNPLAPKPQNFPAKAKSCIFMYMSGGVSQVDTFDFKPKLQKMGGQRMPMISEVSGQIEALLKADNQLLPSPFEFAPFGHSGRYINKSFEQFGPCVDDLAFLYGIKGDSNSHGASTMQINTGSIFQGSPSVGAWIVYGLGTENQNVPGYIVLQDPRGGPMNGAAVWQSGYLPAAFQGTALRTVGTPILDLLPPAGMTRERERKDLDFLRFLNERHAGKETRNDDLEARIAAYELAFRMQAEANDLVSIAKEPDHIRKLYGLDDPITAPFGGQCLLARRLIESGVRFVLLIHGYENGVQSWDQHNQLEEFLLLRMREVDRPVAALIKDLKQRGLFDQTLLAWTSEMGRTPMAQGTGDRKRLGRNHNQYGLVSWLGGGGIRGGATVGQTDDFGLSSVGDPIRVRDFHATVLHAMGLDDNALTFLHQGRYKKLTDDPPPGGHVLEEVFA
jgi:hypothetical protein